MDGSRTNILLQRLIALTWLLVITALVSLFALTLGPWVWPSAPEAAPVAHAEPEPDPVENGIHLATGLVHAEGFELVRANCLGCHSSKLITQNRNTREGWEQLIDWMQETQGLWDLGEQEVGILNYLSTQYGPTAQGRRPVLQLAESDWYVLEDN
jgi:hypothetical protein